MFSVHYGVITCHNVHRLKKCVSMAQPQTAAAMLGRRGGIKSTS